MTTTIPQTQWQNIVDESAYTVTGLMKEFKLSASSLRRWLTCDGSPTKKNATKMEEIMSKLAHEKRTPPPSVLRLRHAGTGRQAATAWSWPGARHPAAADRKTDRA